MSCLCGNVKVESSTSKKNMAAKNPEMLLYKVLTPELKKKYADVKTKFGGTLEQCTLSGELYPTSSVGLYATDEDSYEAFKELFEGVIFLRHHLKEHPGKDWGNLTDWKGRTLEDPRSLVLSTRIRVARCIKDYSFPAGITKESRDELEKKTSDSLKECDNGKGTYYPLVDLSEEQINKWVEDHYLYRLDDKCLEVAGFYGDLPTGRGIWFAKDMLTLVWVNEEDHLRIISMDKGANIGEVYCKLADIADTIEKRLPFAHHDGYGFLASCPSNIGTGLRASVLIKLEYLSKCPDLLKKLAKAMRLDVRGSDGEHSDSAGGCYDISNIQRMGMTENDLLTLMVNGCQAIIDLENHLASMAETK